MLTTASVDLPAHNVFTTAGHTGPTIPDPECLADPDNGLEVLISSADDSFRIGASATSGGGSRLGFGLFALPAGATLVDCRFVGHIRAESSGPVPAGSWDSSVVSPVPTVYPSLGLSYGGDALTGPGYTLTAPVAGDYAEVVGSPIRHVLSASVGGTADYVISGIGTPDTGNNGLGPEVVIADTNWWEMPSAVHPIHVSYLAIRVTYTLDVPSTGGWKVGATGGSLR